MRDYAELVKALRTCKLSIPCTECPFYSNGDEPSKECATMNVAAADAIEELLTAVPKWISVEERLPKPGEVVLTYNSLLGLQNYGIDLVLDGEWHFDEFTQWWMPLPEPPKEDAE